ncbi:MAG: hypothetical protein K0R90_1551 [Oscillospiraceae bacterium]|jgi:quinol monooxygenase YgiN|nr:hypothetical protein [Oscillospiraceae bacterium]
MIKVVAKNYIKADKVDEFIVLAKKLVQETVQKDAGCIRYELFQDISNPQVLTIIEEWENKDLLDLHMSAKHFKEIVPLFGGFTERPGETNLYQKLV